MRCWYNVPEYVTQIIYSKEIERSFPLVFVCCCFAASSESSTWRRASARAFKRLRIGRGEKGQHTTRLVEILSTLVFKTSLSLYNHLILVSYDFYILLSPPPHHRLLPLSTDWIDWIFHLDSFLFVFTLLSAPRRSVMSTQKSSVERKLMLIRLDEIQDNLCVFLRAEYGIALSYSWPTPAASLTLFQCCLSHPTSSNDFFLLPLYLLPMLPNKSQWLPDDIEQRWGDFSMLFFPINPHYRQSIHQTHIYDGGQERSTWEEIFSHKIVKSTVAAAASDENGRTNACAG